LGNHFKLSKEQSLKTDAEEKYTAKVPYAQPFVYDDLNETRYSPCSKSVSKYSGNSRN